MRGGPVNTIVLLAVARASSSLSSASLTRRIASVAILRVKPAKMAANFDPATGFCSPNPSVRMPGSMNSPAPAAMRPMTTKSNILPFDDMRGLDREMISLVVPVYNEAANLHDLWTRLVAVMPGMGRPWEAVFVDDGSTDDSLSMLKRFAEEVPGHVRVIELARNFGQHSAVLAGFKQAKGDIIVTLDADLQNPPEEIPRLIQAIDDGNDVVGGWREERQDQAFRRVASRYHNKLTSAIVGVPMHDYGCMLRAYRRHIVDAVVQCDEKAAFVPALANSFAKRVAEIPVGHAERAAGDSKYNLFRLATLSLNLITGFSPVAIQLLTLFGIVVFLLVGMLVLLLAGHRVIYGPQEEGALWVLFTVQFALIGFLFLALGLIGEFIYRIYLEVRRRPTYLVRKIHGDDDGQDQASPRS
jgi:undecaprenyl-phosphate 4-deoxy-4-formamido-L-arabinose transferase